MADIHLDIPILQFIENVGSAPNEVTGRYSELIVGTPVAINASLWGWVNRTRMFWLAGTTEKLSEKNHKQIKLPEGFMLACRQRSPLIMEIARAEEKAWPSMVPFKDGFVPAFAPGAHRRRMHTLTREFRHPTDRTYKCSADAVNRLHADARRFPPGAYEEESLLICSITTSTASPHHNNGHCSFTDISWPTSLHAASRWSPNHRGQPSSTAMPSTLRSRDSSHVWGGWSSQLVVVDPWGIARCCLTVSGLHGRPVNRFSLLRPSPCP